MARISRSTLRPASTPPRAIPPRISSFCSSVPKLLRRLGDDQGRGVAVDRCEPAGCLLHEDAGVDHAATPSPVLLVDGDPRANRCRRASRRSPSSAARCSRWSVARVLGLAAPAGGSPRRSCAARRRTRNPRGGNLGELSRCRPCRAGTGPASKRGRSRVLVAVQKRRHVRHRIEYLERATAATLAEPGGEVR